MGFRHFCSTGTRVNKALTVLSRRDADKAVSAGRVTINGNTAMLGQKVNAGDKVCLDGKIVAWETKINARQQGPQV